MTTKWTIRRYSKTWPDGGPVWVVTAPDVRLVQEKVWVNNFLPSDRYKYCDTFAEAIAWATEENMFTQTLIEALAEETWEYGVQSCEYSESAKMWSGWGHFAIPFDKQRTRESCEQFIKGRLDPRFEYRLVRRRVSPVEVVDD